MSNKMQLQKKARLILLCTSGDFGNSKTRHIYILQEENLRHLAMMTLLSTDQAAAM